jgi:hypothetical protein
VKRYIFAATLLICLAALLLGGDRLLGRVLDERLGPLLTRELGLPVTLDPIDAQILALTASTRRLVMGRADEPAVVATDVSVSLVWSDLLKGDIRLIAASGSDLTLQLSNWPTNDAPWPTDYFFLDPWLPQDLQVSTGRYVQQDGDQYELSEFHWQRDRDGGASLTVAREAGGEKLLLNSTLDSLNQLLALKDITLGMELQVAGAPESAVEITTSLSQPEGVGYTLFAQVETAGLNARISAENEETWSVPGASQTNIPSLEVDKLRPVLTAYLDSSLYTPESGDESRPTRSNFELPEHQGKVTIEKLAIGDEYAVNNGFAFSTGSEGLQISELVSHGPRGVLGGQFSLSNSSGTLQLDLNADIKARDNQATLGEQYLGADWMWQTGKTQLSGSGKDLDALLDSLEGDLSLEGFHRGQVNTPVGLTARLDNDPSKTSLDHMEIALGKARILGNASLSRKDGRRLLKLDVTAREMDLEFLFEGTDIEPQAGVAIPSYLGSFPGIDLQWKLHMDNLLTPALSLSSAQINLQRSPESGQLDIRAVGVTGGSMNLLLDSNTLAEDVSKVELSWEMTNIDLSELFHQDYLLHSRTTGRVDFSAEGKGLNAIFQALQGRAELESHFRRNKDDWDRKSRPEEQLELSGDAQMVIDEDRIFGFKIENLDVDSIQQDVSGTLSMVAERNPWLMAEFEAQQLDISGLIDLLPDTTAQADRTDLLQTLNELGAARLSLSAKNAVYRDNTVSDLVLEVTSGERLFNVDQLDFTLDGNPFKSRGGLSWKDKKAAFSGEASVNNFDLDRFLIQDPDFVHVPVSGSVDLASKGAKFAELLANLHGQISLAAANPQLATEPTARRNLEMQVRRMPDGLHADVSRFQWGRNDLRGSVRYHDIDRPKFEIDIEGGSLSLTLWERQQDAESGDATEKQRSGFASAASTSARLVNDILRSPFRLFSGPGEADPGEKMFNSEPLPFDSLRDYDATVTANLGKLESLAGSIGGLQVNARVDHGRLELDASAASFNSGKAELQLALDTSRVPPTFDLTGTTSNAYGPSSEPTFPRSSFFQLSSTGSSTAEIASNLNGQLYLELGKGPFDYVNVSMLTSDVASSVAKTLIPGIEKTEPELECGVALGVFNNGVGITPFGYALRTDKANLIGRLKIDLTKELMELALDSRSREGVGLSVGNVFSNTIRVKGPLTNPQIVPHTTGLLWRGWAAFMTAGLSVVGESVIKRALSAENPCKSLKKDIRKEVCGTEEPMAGSPLVCGAA